MFPTGEPLAEGDIVLARSYGLIGALFANYSQPGGKYSHGALVYRDAGGGLKMFNYRPTGMETCSPEEFFGRYNRLALIRPIRGLEGARTPEYARDGGAGPTGAAALSAAARSWLAKNSRRRIPPDYRLDHDNHDSMFCLELPSAVYRDCGLPDPFFRARRADEDALLTSANRMFKAGVLEIRSPASAIDNPDFQLIAEWLRPDYDLRREALNEEVMRVLAEDIGAGHRPRRPNFAGRLKLRQIFVLYRLSTRLMFWRPRQELPDFIDAEAVDNAYMLYSYAAKGKKLAQARMRRETRPQFAGTRDSGELEKVRRIAAEAMACFRDRYLTR
ncbi:MAG: hypothetical protein LBU64_01675 [Planctomycetota bacterium]|nr:hypothetical protein [Planctomycetota bacterium]